ncbi:MAG: hypothetical protein RSB60_05470 [Anaerorhabdus sp.]
MNDFISREENSDDVSINGDGQNETPIATEDSFNDSNSDTDLPSSEIQQEEPVGVVTTETIDYTEQIQLVLDNQTKSLELNTTLVNNSMDLIVLMSVLICLTCVKVIYEWLKRFI